MEGYGVETGGRWKLGKPKLRWENNILIYILEMRFEGV
jgi:hypothetical protein